MVAMSEDPRSREVVVPWESGGQKGFARLALGTLQFLGINPPDAEDSVISYTVPAKRISRRLYPGGPSVSYDRPVTTITKALGGGVSTAKSNRKIILQTNNQQDTIYYTGSRPRFLSWLKANGNGSSVPIQIRGANGNPLGFLGLPDAPGGPLA
jgi:hypothetical protein